MNLKISKINMVLYLFFFIYFITYIDSKTYYKYIAVIILQCAMLVQVRSCGFTKIDRKMKQVLLCLSISLLVSSCVNYDIGGLIKTISLIDLLILTGVMFPVFMKKKQFSLYALIMVISNALFISLLIAFITKYNDVFAVVGRSTSASIRHVFGFGVPSIVGYLCFVEFVLSCYLLILNYNNIKQVLILVPKFLLSFAMCYLADIRAAIVSMILFVLLYIFNGFPNNKTYKCIKIVVYFLFFTISVFFVIGGALDFNKINYLLSYRFDYYANAISKAIEKNFLFGVGAFKNSEVDVRSMVQVDNCFIDLFYQYGLIVLVMFFFLMFVIGKKLYSLPKVKSSLNTIEQRYFKSYFITVLIYSMAEKNLFSLSSALSLVTFVLLFSYISKLESINTTIIPKEVS